MRHLPTMLMAWSLLLAWNCADSSEGVGNGHDSADADTDTDTDIDTDHPSSMSECAGGKLDPVTGICWQNPPGDMTMNWYQASGTHHAYHNPQTKDYCAELIHGGHSDWRLPDIDELISLLRGCVNGTDTGDFQSSICEMTPAGCAATDNCDDRIDCASCSWLNGPGTDGCYIDPTLCGNCDWYWSSSSLATNAQSAWRVRFGSGGVSNDAKVGEYHVRCVR